MNQAVTINAAQASAAQPEENSGAAVSLRWQRRLWALLFVQILLVVGIFAYQKNMRAAPAAVPLLPVSANLINRIEIADASTNVQLDKAANRWQLTQSGLPVDNEKITALLDKLAALRLTWPVANTASSHERFDVGDAKFQRKLRLYEGDKLHAEFYLGSSPGFKKVHLRRAGDNQVYAVSLSTLDASTQTDDWLNKSLLATNNLTNITAADYQLQKQGDQWSLQNDADTALDAAKVGVLVSAIASLQVESVAQQKPEGEVFRLAVKSSEGNWQYEFIKTDAGHFVKRSDRNEFFMLSQYEYERIVGVNRAGLLAPDNAASATPTSANPVETVVQEATKGLLGN